MKNRIFEKHIDISGTDYRANITCNQVSPKRYNVYGRLQDSKGVSVPGVKPIRLTANSPEKAKALVEKIRYILAGRVSNSNAAPLARKDRHAQQNAIDAAVQSMLDNETVFYNADVAGSVKAAWNWNTHRTVYTYFLNHGFSELLLRMAESENPEEELKQFRDELINKTYEHGRSKKNRDQAANTVDVSLARMTILVRQLCKEHPEFPNFDLTKGLLMGRAVPQEQVKAMPEEMCQRFRKDLEDTIQSKPALVLCAVLMFDGALRTAEAAGIKVGSIVFYDEYAIVPVLHQEKDGVRIDRLKTDNAYRYVVLSFWGMTMARKCLDELGLDEGDERLLLRAKDLSHWVKARLRSYNAEFMKTAEDTERTNPDYDDNGNPVYDVSAYILRRNAASSWLNYDGLTHDEIDIMLGHKEKQQRPEIYLMDEAHQREIAKKLERYVYNPEISRNPAFTPVQACPDTRMDLDAYPVHLIRNDSDQPLRIHLDVVACSPNEAITLCAPQAAAEEPICRSEKLKPASRIVINANMKFNQEGDPCP